MERRQGRTVSIGRQSFARLREDGYFYVDKTAFIREWWESGDDITLIARPRRFGKTLNMQMLQSFFGLEYAGRADLFEGLEIWKDPAMRALQGTVPVVSLTFSSVKDRSFEGAMGHIGSLLSMLYAANSHLLEGGLLNDEERVAFAAVRRGMDQDTAETSLLNLCVWLERAHGVRPIVLLDEYDAPMQEAWAGGFWDDMCAFMRSFLNATFKANPALGRGLLTGVTRVSRESIFSGLNNLRTVTTLTEMYEDAFGFTEEEVFAALDEMGMGERREEARLWYDGFTFGRASGIYNPWSVTCYLKERKPGAYWANTSSNGLVDELVRTGGARLKADMEELLRGGTIEALVDEQVDFRHLASTPDAVWSLLLATGYLRVAAPADVDPLDPVGGERTALALTNLEVRRMFGAMVRGWFSGGAAEVYGEFVRCLLAGDVAGMERFLNEVALRTFSFFDVGGEGGSSPDPDDGVAGPERFYHGFVLGLLVELHGRYEVTSNRESGYGRYDVVLRPLRDGDPAYVLEFKALDRGAGEQSLEDALAAAKAQIADRAYAASLEAAGIERGRIRELGIAFQGKRCIVG